ncbi:adenosine deaminase isoform X1 [Patella vulgata]|uniref:adenosine deaminase isoform X1 n=1 Tax=Patella vulgata TaxID=6465 RepID=UPI0024A94656|nr:adenosine deaminase isoform X1 [Patella vulgata]
MAAESMDSFPYKVELHVHIDGAVRPKTLLQIASKRGIPLPYKDEASLSKAICIKEPCTLQVLLKAFDEYMPILAGDKSALYRMAYEFCEDCANQGIRYVEARYSPHELANNSPEPEHALEPGNLSPTDVVATICEGLQKGSSDFAINAKSILCCMRHRPEWSMEVVDLCRRYHDSGVVGIDIAGEEYLVCSQDGAKSIHQQAFLEACKLDIHRTAHAGEVGSSQVVKEAMDQLKVERIGHGYLILDDKELYARAHRQDVHFELCPISSIRTSAVGADITKHPMLRFADDNMNYSINTDDPVIFTNTLLEDYQMALQAGLTRQQIITTIFNAAKSSFAPEKEKTQILNDLVQVYETSGDS